jgi:hypothetical protein
MSSGGDAKLFARVRDKLYYFPIGLIVRCPVWLYPLPRILSYALLVLNVTGRRDSPAQLPFFVTVVYPLLPFYTVIP